MPAVINVGGPMVWGLVILLSAWAVRAGRALARRRRKRSSEDDEILLIDPNATQPRFLQRLSATAIRMLIETGALPCAVLEIADGGGSSCSSKHGRGGAKPSSGSRTGGPAALPQPPARIVPPELAAAVPCMPAAAWVRALPGLEVWRSELVHAATAAAGGSIAATTSLRSSYASLLGPPGGRDAATLGGNTSTVGLQAWRGRLGLPLRSAHLPPSGDRGEGPVSATAAVAAAAAAAAAVGGSAGAVSGSSTVHASAPQHHQQDDSQGPPVLTAAETAALGSNTHLLPLPRTPMPPPLQLQPQQLPTGPHPPAATDTRGGGLQGGGLAMSSSNPYNSVSRSTGSGAAAAIAAAAAANMAALPYPPRHALLVVLGRDERSVAAVTAAAAAAGYSRVAVWYGTQEAFAATCLSGPRLPTISRNALWLILQLGQEPLFHVPATVLDVRRPDERLSYGAIRGTVNVPAEELAAALALPAPDFRQRYGVPQLAEEDVVVLLSRSGRRAAWAAQLCWDAGLRRVFIFEEGVCGWRLEDRVKPYRAYDMGALPPDPELFTPEEADEAAGFEELHKLGMPMRQGARPSRFAVMPQSAAGAIAAAPGPGRMHTDGLPPSSTTTPVQEDPNGGPVLAAGRPNAVGDGVGPNGAAGGGSCGQPL